MGIFFLFVCWLPEDRDKVKTNLIKFNEGLYVAISMNINEHFNREKTLKVISCNINKINIKGSFFKFSYVYIFAAQPRIASRSYSGLSFFDLS